MATCLDDVLAGEPVLTPDAVLSACREIKTAFFRENRVLREEVAAELSSILETPPLKVELAKFTPAGHSESENPDLFLSYFHEDAAFVRRLAEAVCSSGFSVWYDRRGLTAGRSFPTEIEDALARTRFVGVVATSTSVERPWVRKEVDATYIREAEEDRELLIPLRLSAGELPLFMKAKTWCDFTGSFEVGLSCLLAAIS